MGTSRNGLALVLHLPMQAPRQGCSTPNHRAPGSFLRLRARLRRPRHSHSSIRNSVSTKLIDHSKAIRAVEFPIRGKTLPAMPSRESKWRAMNAGWEVPPQGAQKLAYHRWKKQRQREMLLVYGDPAGRWKPEQEPPGLPVPGRPWWRKSRERLGLPVPPLPLPSPHRDPALARAQADLRKLRRRKLTQGR